MSYHPDHRSVYGYQQGHAMAMHIDDEESDTDDSDKEDPMVHAGSPAMFPSIGSPYGQPISNVGSPEDVKPNLGYSGATSPPARGLGGHLPWMTDGQGQTASMPVSAAPSPRTPFDIKSEMDDGMDVDVNLNSEASESGSEGGGEELRTQPELTLEQKMQQRFPTFEKHRPLKFTDLQAIDLREPKKRRLDDHVVSSIESEHPLHSQEASFLRPWAVAEGVHQGRVLTLAASSSRRARQRSDALSSQNRMHRLVEESSGSTGSGKGSEAALETIKDKKPSAMVELYNWEDQIVYGADTLAKKKSMDRGLAQLPQERGGIKSLNLAVKNDDWLSNVVFGVPLPGYEDDEDHHAGDEPEVTPSQPAPEPSRMVKAIRVIRTPRTDVNGLSLDFYNWSNDHYYPPQKAQKVTIRQTGLIEIIHAGPAVKLQMPFYKSHLTAAEKRIRNRPMLQFPTGVPIHFDKLLPSTNRTKQQREAIKAMERQGKKVEPEIPQSSKDLSMANRVPFVLLEYSEETPLALPGYGMGSSMINYYKKTTTDDTDLPSHKTGQPVILQPGDPQPYPLAFIDPGQSIQSLQTTFSNAPIFAHEPSPSDFLVIRRTVDGQSRYFIREINNIFAVGQTLPAVSQTKQHLMDMPTSQAATRRGTRWIRIIIKKLLAKHDGIIKQSHLRPFWPEWSDRDWTLFLKTFMFSESKKHEKFWRPMIDESGVNKTDIELDKVDMTPEELVLHASMGQAEQWLADHGHPLPANAKDEKVMIKEMNDSRDFTGEERDKYIELRLAPWYRSQNYSAAAQTSLASGTGSNALSNVLQLKDEGDPTGRGEGFSLLECSRKQMPELFKRTMQKSKSRRGGDEEGKQNNKLNRDELIQAYTLQQQKIWEAQRRSLGNSLPPKPDKVDDKRAIQRAKFERQEQERQSRLRQRYEDEQMQYQIGSDRKLRITRQNNDGTIEHEEITDPVVITAYMRAKLTESIKKDGMADGGMYKELGRYEGKVANLNSFKIKIVGENMHELQKAKTGKTEAPAKRTIKCKQCGEIGHNSMSDVCPKNQDNPDFQARKEASKASKRGKRSWNPEVNKSKEFKQGDLRASERREGGEGVGGGAGGLGGVGAGVGAGAGVGGAGASIPMGTAGFKVKLNLGGSSSAGV